ncbi:MAG TPA: Crp/Fnr family transcriptional regulator [Candidatus Sulfotelmatobacter sp.]|nr:Crp/Fnr family transcriptional regulator [Candidatus Sulfotelmatobacter sp.]
MDLETFVAKHRISLTLNEMFLFRGLPRDVIRQAEAKCVWKLFPKESTIITQDDLAQDVLFVRHGLVRVVQFTASGREISYADNGPGGHFGEIAAIDGGPRSAYVIALFDTVAAVLSGKDFLLLLRNHPEFAVNVMRTLTAIVRGINIRLRDLSALRAPDRVAVELVRLARQWSRGETASRITIRPAPTATDIANRAATTRETVARTFADLTRRKLIRRVGHDLEILDVFALEDSVQELL